MGSLLKIKHGYMHRVLICIIDIEILRLALDCRFHQNNGINLYLKINN